MQELILSLYLSCIVDLLNSRLVAISFLFQRHAYEITFRIAEQRLESPKKSESCFQKLWGLLYLFSADIQKFRHREHIFIPTA